MGLSVGIVGLPNVGKSTLFNALLKKQQAYVANFPFATIEPNVGIVPVPDNRLKQLSQAVKESENLTFFPPEVPADSTGGRSICRYCRFNCRGFKRRGTGK